MSRLDFHKEYKQAIVAGVNAAGNYQPVTNWELGIPISSLKQMDKAVFTQVGVGAGAVITVWGSIVSNFDNPNPWFDITVPVTNGNNFTAISGFMRRQRSTEQLSITQSTNVGARATKVGAVGTGIVGATNEVYDFKFTYTLT